MLSRITLSALGATLALATGTPAMAQNNIVNGGFENQVGFTGNPYDYSNTVTAWKTNTAWDAAGYNAVVGSAYGNPHSGSYSVRFGFDNNTVYAGTATTLSQTFADIVGAIYNVSFYTYNGQYVGDITSRPYNYLTASVGSQSVSVADNVGTYSNGCATCWVSKTFNFTGTGSDTLSFAAYTDLNYWHLDDVSVSLASLPTGAVPEPATWAMMLLGFGMVGARMRYRRKATDIGFA